MTDTEVYVGFDGGPLDGVNINGLVARAIIGVDPPFACLNVGGVFEHYVKTEDCECGRPCFGYAGGCAEITAHPPCGHDHSQD